MTKRTYTEAQEAAEAAEICSRLRIRGELHAVIAAANKRLAEITHITVDVDLELVPSEEEYPELHIDHG